MPRRAVDPNQSFPALELEVLDRWRERDIFQESLRRRAGAEPWIFYEGPPTANGRPGSHHVLARVFKDIFPRYKTMRGHLVERKGGWDCHGLPVEIAVERELGITRKEEIEAYGIAAFNERCRESVFTYLEDWNRLTERIGFWLDLDDAYRTLDPSYIESVWWALKQIADKDLLYEGHKVVPYCPRCGTALSSHEVAQGYRDVVDPSVYVRFPCAPTTARRGGRRAARVDHDAVDARVQRGGGRGRRPALRPGHGARVPAPMILAEALVERVLGTEGVTVLDAFPGRELEGTAYEPPFGFIPASAYGERATPSCSATSSPPTTARAWSTRRSPSARTTSASGSRPAWPWSTPSASTARTTSASRATRAGGQGRRPRPDRGPRGRGRVLRVQEYEHAYPHCWRCGTPLLYYAKPSWYIATSGLHDRSSPRTRRSPGIPSTSSTGASGTGWPATSTGRCRASATGARRLPVWRCEAGHVHVIGSFDELEELSGVRLEDPHRPYVDEVGFPCPQCARRMERVPEVIDVWFDSGRCPSPSSTRR
jgi:isoleucyl-tRNA synthetase